MASEIDFRLIYKASASVIKPYLTCEYKTRLKARIWYQRLIAD
jgi:hypothetical protein